jgi:hypothetical protein
MTTPPALMALVPKLIKCSSSIDAWYLLADVLDAIGYCGTCRGRGSVMVTVEAESGGRIDNTGDYTETDCRKCKGTGKK